MRIGNNPNNHKIMDLDTTSHRVIIPVYIPNAEGYFSDSLDVLKVCIESLLLTINKDTAVSVISNGSSVDVNNFIMTLMSEGKIDRAVFNKENVGKMNAVMTETRASFEEFITYSDADVFFDKGWLKETYSIFEAFPKAGFVSMNPMPCSYGYSSSAIIDTLLSIKKNSVKIKEVTPYEDLEHFHKSIGRDTAATQKLFSDTAILLSKKKIRCYIGAGHFCCTIRKKAVLPYVPQEKSNTSGSEKYYLDVPSEQSGYWRLSSVKSYVWHMGNVLESDWVKSKINGMSEFKEDDFSFGSGIADASLFFSKLLPYKVKVRTGGFLRKMKILK